MNGWLKVFLVVFVALFVSTFVVRYNAMTERESRKPFQERYEKSYAVKALSYSSASKIHARFPKITEFVIGLDPRASWLAGVRWVLIAFVGWIHFCFISPLSEQVGRYFSSGFELFLLPVKIALWLCPLFLVSSILKYFNPQYGGYLHSSLVWMLGGLAIVVGLTSLCSIPAHIILLVRNLIWKSKATAVSGFRKEPSQLPGPVVRRTEIDGVMYDI